MWGILGVAALIGTGIGINSAIGGGGELPQIADNDDDNEKNCPRCSRRLCRLTGALGNEKCHDEGLLHGLSANKS